MSRASQFPTAASADIALLLEGTFPYVSGGVSSWVNQILQAYPEHRFAIVFLGSRREDYGDFRYALPPNVVHFEQHFLFDALHSNIQPAPSRGHPEALAKAREFLQALEAHDGTAESRAKVLAAMRSIALELQPGGSLPLEDFLHSEFAWDLIRDSYRRHCTDPSFVDFFWTVRIMLQPLWLMARIAHGLIPVRVLHTVSTGYAGFLGGLLHHSRGLPLVLSEHGIYTKERQIDLLQSTWIRDNRNIFQRDPMEVSFFRQMWIRFFDWMGRFCYGAADPIIALYENNRLRQVADGAAAERTVSIPNGIRIERFAPLRAQRPAETPPVLCLIGRVVPIKDIKTFIRAMRRVVNRMPQAQAWVAGPTAEDPAYADECQNLVDSLGLQANVRFLGMQKVEELLPKVGVVVLSSISEALPLVILEAQAAGVPVVSTDVGSCRQLIDGLGPEDQALGSCGRVVGIANPEALADACLELLASPGQWQAASAAGIARVERYYSDRLLFERYRQVYDRALQQSEEKH
ncbi:GT4 family glycosyltransferase PelF [Delftia tsuruhatensis]|uniref:Glycosyl transferase family 1 n=1 Tax=Delftia tsuruhatensis TaxID=180282 RepID=A0ABN4SMZ8_9BURK|nr:GT4 family glycosyltransferase PelF [Delftia tsuruhatensis]AOV04793.1 glycosyl transferase family 1 [Delftia tsuruhatensis]MCO5335071.1 GT4 family glycosyltransferase PelF [Delftia tsuruhatensis]MCR4542831.1 GT4 family glycosyltransferase PelF [Delftia tsuruhatensis]MDH2233138.1 GT4 family glycosyltransferase PelF [Delftia tsuruhatensis]